MTKLADKTVTKKILLGNADRAADFVNAAAKSACTVDIRSGRYLVDGKSILGVLSLPLDTPADAIISGNADSIKELLVSIREYCI